MSFVPVFAATRLGGGSGPPPGPPNVMVDFINVSDPATLTGFTGIVNAVPASGHYIVNDPVFGTKGPFSSTDWSYSDGSDSDSFNIILNFTAQASDASGNPIGDPGNTFVTQVPSAPNVTATSATGFTADLDGFTLFNPDSEFLRVEVYLDDSLDNPVGQSAGPVGAGDGSATPGYVWDGPTLTPDTDYWVGTGICDQFGNGYPGSQQGPLVMIHTGT